MRTKCGSSLPPRVVNASHLQASELYQWRSLNLASIPLFLVSANELEQRFVDFLRVTEAQEVLTVLDHLELCVLTVNEERDLLSRVLRAVKPLVRKVRSTP